MSISRRIFIGDSAELRTIFIALYESFKAFHRVVDGIFGNRLASDWEERVAEAKLKIEATSISITTKVRGENSMC